MGNAKSAEVKDKEERPEKTQSTRERKPKISAPDGRSQTVNGKTRSIHSARASMSSQGNRKPVLGSSQRTIVKYCLDNAKDDIAERIIRRATERKDDFKSFVEGLQRQQRQEVLDSLKDFLMRIGDNLTDSETIQTISSEFGSAHVAYRPLGFKPDFFACTADAVTTECTFLDAATHGASDTAGAWSQLSAFIFSSVRDGYYAELRKQRKQSLTKSDLRNPDIKTIKEVSNAFRNRQSFDVSTDGSATNEDSRRSASPNENSTSGGSNPDEFPSDAPSTTAPASNFLLPPTVY